MSIRYILFDLDGTLLPMDQDLFIHAYFTAMSAHMAPHGYIPETFIQTVWQSTGAMFHNDGSVTNETAFWNAFCSVYGENARACEPILDLFYQNEFPKIKSSCGYTPQAAQLIAALKQMGYSLVLATNPIFPAIATESRMIWAGLNKEDFLLYTTYENSSYCKPNPKYYQEVLQKIGANPAECLMVGNDATEDLAALTLGIPVFLLTDCLINKHNIDVSQYPHGDFNALIEYIRSL